MALSAVGVALSVVGVVLSDACADVANLTCFFWIAREEGIFGRGEA